MLRIVELTTHEERSIFTAGSEPQVESDGEG